MMTKRESGALGGKKTASRYGSTHYKNIGRDGGSYRLPTLEEKRLMAEIKNKNNKKGGSRGICNNSNNLNNNTFQMPSGEIIKRSKSGMVKQVGAAS